MSTIAACAAACKTFDAIPTEIRNRDDLGTGPKLLYGLLNSAANQQQGPTQVELAASLRVSVRSIIRWTKDLILVGLLAVRKRGQGLSQLYTLLGARILRRDRWASLGRPDGQSTTRRDRRPPRKEVERRGRYSVYRTPEPSAYLQTRRGVLAKR